MSDTDQRTELDAFFHLFASFDLGRPVATIDDLTDGAALYDVLSLADSAYFRNPHSSSSPPSDNWVIRFSALKRLYRLMTQYFADNLHKPTTALDVPDLQAMAKDSDVKATLLMCRLTIAIGVHCEQNEQFITKIQALTETDQHHLMRAIEQTMANIRESSQDPSYSEASNAEDDHFYRLQSEKSKILNEKDTLQKVYSELLEEHRALQTNHDDVISEKEEALARLRAADRHSEHQRNDKADAFMRAEIDRLRGELQKSEDNLAAAEGEIEKQNGVVSDMERKIEDLQSLADSAARLKDQVDEYKHAAERLQKNENVMEKYKKKLQEGADLRQNVKALEKQNADLVDKNAALEEEYRKVSAFKPLMESYKNQIAELEAKGSSRAQELDTVKFELEQTRTKLKIVSEERAKDSETLELYQERVRELELTSHTRPSTTKTKPTEPQNDDSTTSDSLGNEEEVDGEDSVTHGLGGELDDAISGTTMTDLKLQIRKLKRELEAVRKNEADASRILVLENLLEDANRMKSRYEADYLASHREKLVLQRDLEEIRSGKSMGDGQVIVLMAEAAIALRQRLNEAIEQLDVLRKEHAELEIKSETQEKELIVAKSDLNLVNKDQLDILATLRESVNEDKAGMEADMFKLKDQIKELSEKNRMQLEQVNGLLLEKINLQSEGIGHRDAMLQRERDLGDLKASISGKDLPEDIKARLLALHEDNITLKETQKTLQTQLTKARTFIKDQDRLFKEQHATAAAGLSLGDLEAADPSLRSENKILKEDLDRERQLRSNMTKRYRKEQELMLSYLHSAGMVRARNSLSPQTKEPASWLGQQRKGRSLALQRP